MTPASVMCDCTILINAKSRTVQSIWILFLPLAPLPRAEIDSMKRACEASEAFEQTPV